MGQSASIIDGVASAPQVMKDGTPPVKVEVGRRRTDYLRRLGISKATNTPWQKADNYVEEKNSDLIEEAKDIHKEGNSNIHHIKNQNDFRINFLRKLSYEKVWVPNAHQSPKHQTVIIFDWDDTLLCTSFLQLNQDYALSYVVREYVQKIEIVVKQLLQLAMQLGHTFIITNSFIGWVEYSAAKWIPDLVPLLQKVPVISARKYAPQFPGEVNKWKIQAFLEVQKQLDSQIITNLISLGDSNYEMEAVQVMAKGFAQALIKTIKFPENPSPSELLKQLQLVTQKLKRIVENACNLNLGQG